MYPVSARFEAAVRKSHTPVASVTLDGDELPVEAASVTLDSKAAIRGSLTLTLAPGIDLADLVLTDPDSKLAPYRNEIQAYRGIRFPDGDELVPLGVFRIDETSVEESAGSDVGLSVVAYDRSAQVVEAVFVSAGTIASGTNAATAILNVVGAVVPNLAYDFDATSVTLPTLA